MGNRPSHHITPTLRGCASYSWTYVLDVSRSFTGAKGSKSLTRITVEHLGFVYYVRREQRRVGDHLDAAPCSARLGPNGCQARRSYPAAVNEMSGQPDRNS